MAMQAWFAKMNAKHGAFVVTRWSSKSGRQIVVGKVHHTIEAANAAALTADKRNPVHMHFVDIASSYGRAA